MSATGMSTPRPQKPLELILARNLLTSISTPGFLLDSDAAVVFYKRGRRGAARRSFEEAGRMEADQWTEAFGPFDVKGTPVEVDALRDDGGDPQGTAAHATFTIKVAGGANRGRSRPAPSRSSPLEEGSSGAMILFWPLGENGTPANPGTPAGAAEEVAG